MTTTRPDFEAVLTGTIIPELIAEVSKTGISENAIEWVTKVWAPFISFVGSIKLDSALTFGRLAFSPSIAQSLTKCDHLEPNA